jgi:hypothetical protein
MKPSHLLVVALANSAAAGAIHSFAAPGGYKSTGHKTALVSKTAPAGVYKTAPAEKGTWTYYFSSTSTSYQIVDTVTFGAPTSYVDIYPTMTETETASTPSTYYGSTETVVQSIPVFGFVSYVTPTLTAPIVSVPVRCTCG